jgi:hypothetical protein
MATAAAPYGLKPVKKINGDPWTGATNTYRIQSNYATAIYTGNPVILASGFITVPAGADLGAGTPERFIGVFMGCSYTDPSTKQLTFKQYYPANTVASDILAYVADDPELMFQIQVNTASFDALAVVGSANCYAMTSASSGSATYGNSTIALDVDGTPAAASNLPWRIMGIATLPDNTNASGFVDAYVKINGGFHVLTRAG